MYLNTYTVAYLFQQEPRNHTFELEAPELPPHEAALHLIQLHFGDSENSLNMPNADATPDDILKQAEVLGFTEIRITRPE
jgi:hypothetical protein